MHHNSDISYCVDLRKQKAKAVDISHIPVFDTYVQKKENSTPRVAQQSTNKKFPLFFRTVAFLVLFGLVIAPAGHVYADEVVTESTPDIVQQIEITSSESVVEEAQEPVAIEEVGGSSLTDHDKSEEVTSNTLGENNSEETQEASGELTPQTENGEEINESSVESQDSSINDSEPDSVVTEDVDDVSEEVSLTEGDFEENTPSGDEEDNNNGGTVLGISTTTKDVATTTVATTSTTVDLFDEENNDVSTPEYLYTSNDSKYVFDTSDCVVVKDEEFYCVKKSAPQGTISPKKSEHEEVFAKKDSTGDLEIYLRRGLLTDQITDNTRDDDAPVYDPESGLIVWHALVDDRYQIFVYDTHTKKIQQVTHETYNNINPYVSGTTIAWQGWEDDNWEIFTSVYDFGNGGSEFITTRVTKTNDHDMFPKVYKNFITWQSRVNDEWKSYLYDSTNGQISYLGAGSEGGIESARLVLLVERRTNTGDLEKVGYEVGTGNAIPLGSTPRELPPPVAPIDPLQDQKGVLPSSVASTTVKVSTKDDDDGADATPSPTPEVE